MSLKTSFFNTTLLKSNIRRFWWISAGYVVLFLSLIVLPLINYDYFDSAYFIVTNVITALATALLPAILFSYLNQSGSVTCMHAFPIKRKAHFVTNIATIYLLFLVPMIAGYLFTVIYSVVTGEYSAIPDIFEMLVLGIILMTITASGSTLGVMVTGNTIAAIVFGALFIGFPFYTEAIFKVFLMEKVHGIWQNGDFFMLENFRFHEVNTFMIVYGLISVLIFVVSWLLYKNRKLESNGDIIAFGILKPVFMGCVSVFAGFLGYFYLFGLYNSNNIFFMLPFGLLGIVISFMLSKKAFTFRGIHIPAGLYVLAVILLYVTVEFDLTGFERKIPDIEDIASVNISHRTMYNYSSDEEVYINGNVYYYKSPYKKEDFAFTKEADIQNVVALHKHLISQKNDTDSFCDNQLPIVYTLKNGKEIKRYYELSYDRDKELLAPVYLTDEMRKEKWNVFAKDDTQIVSVTVQDSRLKDVNNPGNDTFAIYPAGDEKAKALINAIKEDIKNVSFEHIYANPRGATTVSIQFTRPLVSREGKPVSDQLHKAEAHGSSFVISPDYTNTIKLLREYGLYDKLISIDDIAYATVSYNHESRSNVKITDKNDIKEIFEFISYYECISKGIDSMMTEYVYNCDISLFTADDREICNYNISNNVNQPLPEILIHEAQKYAEKYHDDVIAESSDEKIIVEKTEVY